MAFSLREVASLFSTWRRDWELSRICMERRKIGKRAIKGVYN